MTRHFGIDFGTSNTAIAVVAQGSPARLLSFPSGAATCRSLLYFEPETHTLHAGDRAQHEYRAHENEGRLVQSLKSHLASPLFDRTRIGDRTWSLPELVAAYLRRLRDQVDLDLGARVVVGRPVQYWGAQEAEDNERAVKRMTEALNLAGFEEVYFELEPVAAAAHVRRRARDREMALIADFGGGTSDFCVLALDEAQAFDRDRVLATSGVAIGGDTIDGRIVDHVVSPALGRDTTYRDAFGGVWPVPAWLYVHLRRWHHLSFLKTPKTLSSLAEIERTCDAPDAIAALRRLVEEDLGFALHRSVEKAKVSRSSERMAAFCFEPIETDLLRASMETWILPELSAVSEALTQVLDAAGIEAEQIGRVFTTGGSSLVPAFRALLGERFGAEKLVGGEELTCVALGLAERAASVFGGREREPQS